MKIPTITQYLIPCLLLLIYSCSTKIDSVVYTEVQKKGNEISGYAQSTLLQNVGMAIQKGGTQYAVEFCNLEASSIIDSLNQQYDCTISRISVKNRNSNAGLSSTHEKELWQIFQKGELTDTIIPSNTNLVFYKPIKIGMPACLKCHGNPESDIDNATRQRLQELYPKDLATGYKLNDFRGLWKIEFTRE